MKEAEPCIAKHSHGVTLDVNRAPKCELRPETKPRQVEENLSGTDLELQGTPD